METTSVITQSGSTAFDHQQVAKNKRKKFNPKYVTNSSSDDDEGGGNMTKDDDRDVNDGNQSSGDENQQNGPQTSADTSNDIIGQIPSVNFSITKNQRNHNSSPLTNPFLSTSKLSLLQTFNLQQQQQLFQQAAINAIAPQFSQQLNSSMNLSETETKFREFAFKTMQELLNIYGLSLPPNEIMEAMKQTSKRFNSIMTNLMTHS